MKVFVPALQKAPGGGKSAFYHRLAKEMRKQGVDVIADPEEICDISLNNVIASHGPSRKKVVRIDGIWHDTAKPWKARNAAISKSLHESDGVVYQSEFSAKMGDVFLGKYKGPRAVIHNGMDSREFASVKPDKSILTGRFNFLAVSKWRPHKRLHEIVDSFLLAGIKDSLLVIAGDLSRAGLRPQAMQNIRSHPRIKYVGVLPQARLASLWKGATASIHLCWSDSCPNSVVEAIVHGVPVICTNTGGTPELVRPSGGKIVYLDHDYPMVACDLYHPPPINKRALATAMQEVTKVSRIISCDHVHIKNIAKQYISFLEEVLCKS